VVGGNNRELLSFRGYYGLMLMESGKLDEARAVYTAAFADIPPDAWADQWFVANDIARTLGALENAAGEYQAALEHCEKAEAATEKKHSGPVGATCVGEALLGLGQAERALAVLEPMAARVRNTDPMQLGAEPAQIGAWRFAYARAVWAVRHDATKARVLAVEARGELGTGSKRTQLDQWLAKLPAK
jgi:tetratricopeptide (TPR) repeat protein